MGLPRLVLYSRNFERGPGVPPSTHSFQYLLNVWVALGAMDKDGLMTLPASIRFNFTWYLWNVRISSLFKTSQITNNFLAPSSCILAPGPKYVAKQELASDYNCFVYREVKGVDIMIYWLFVCLEGGRQAPSLMRAPPILLALPQLTVHCIVHWAAVHFSTTYCSALHLGDFCAD